jgi:predicted transglutaminase-like cysteine proteinase
MKKSKKIIIFLLFMLLPIASAYSKPIKILNTEAIRQKKGFEVFTKWTGMLKRHYKEYNRNKNLCKSNKTCVYNKWFEFINSIKTKSKETQIKSVNAFMNKHRYIIDPINWGVEDYWATVKEFLKKHGDCEDYAISKYLTLKLLGWGTKDLRIVTVMDTNLNIPHSVLAVFGRKEAYILDNQIKVVIPSSRIKHYIPIYSINEEAWWTHKVSQK